MQCIVDPTRSSKAHLASDKHLDIIICNSNEPDVVLYNKGNLTFDPTELPDSTDRSTAILSIGDFTGNGHHDIIIATANDSIVNNLVLNEGGKNFT